MKKLLIFIICTFLFTSQIYSAGRIDAGIPKHYRPSITDKTKEEKVKKEKKEEKQKNSKKKK